ncbi:MAG: hypothetical protein MPK06_05670 [Alphaproteobacteria bacterium]|nr:hypothetical protein [Alphaproteobacteria bacterium]MDA7982936.1 hypothetical protein [Alphaproteobacteria bacterium]MDA7988073.1 hypothetical protein [Alphaproteobacteria bacterium]MDA8000762.1 hypothetical protein [Alphaproteobacteria bacterium]MDA8006009.1 hypothetical protein [Alphaproteobacteria bacterium]
MSEELLVEIFGARPLVFVFLTAALALCGWLGGARLGNGWRDIRETLFYACLTAGFHRFLVYGLAEGDLLSFPGALLSLLMSCAMFLFAWRRRLARRMVSQYPWLYERAGPLSWRPRK